jgi:hypothetical protein
MLSEAFTRGSRRSWALTARACDGVRRWLEPFLMGGKECPGAGGRCQRFRTDPIALPHCRAPFVAAAVTGQLR